MSGARVPFSKANKDYSIYDDPDGNTAFENIREVFEKQHIKFSKTDYDQWKVEIYAHFGTSDYQDIVDILDGTEKPPELAPGESADHLRDRKNTFIRRKKLLLACFSIMMAKYIINKGEDAQFINGQVKPIQDPHQYLIKLDELCSNNQSMHRHM